MATQAVESILPPARGEQNQRALRTRMSVLRIQNAIASGNHGTLQNLLPES